MIPNSIMSFIKSILHHQLSALVQVPALTLPNQHATYDHHLSYTKDQVILDQVIRKNYAAPALPV